MSYIVRVEYEMLPTQFYEMDSRNQCECVARAVVHLPGVESCTIFQATDVMHLENVITRREYERE